MLIPVGFGQANLIFTGSGLPTGAQMTLGFAVPTGVDPTTVANRIITAWTGSGIPGNMPPTLSLTGVLVKFGPSDIGPSALVGASVPGTSAGVQASPNVAVLVHKVTEAGGRSGRGRFYLPGPQEAQIDPNGALATTYRTNLQTGFTNFRNALVTADVLPRLLHGSLSAPIDEPLPITGFVVDARSATQRRRLRR